ncbi:hypothetical protein [Thermaerobacter subterraneus]|uniref:Uncharacterized protein n=1 Tax=Thermaerobacter subterraneus DSM 13965 TaxID=867903 RepID=K6PLW7_9FIRM|nr:hypothetical protein [Thermaerobacter subterraneus]EKP93867.1 hypothetical protein ThesuDRAFT_00111 [Thermaerobacter subterraneus DSM 13965]
MLQAQTGTGGDCWCRIASVVLEALLVAVLRHGVRIGRPTRRRLPLTARRLRRGTRTGGRPGRDNLRRLLRHRRGTA